MNAIDQVRTELVQLWGRLGPFWGISPTTGRVYAYLISQSTPVDADSLMSDLDMSRGAVSMACRELSDWGLVLSERQPGERKLGYRIQEDPSQIIRGIVSTRKRREWDPLLDDVTRWQAQLAGDRSRDARVLRDRLHEIGGLVSVVDSAAQSFLRGGTIPKLGLKGLISMARKKFKRRS